MRACRTSPSAPTTQCPAAARRCRRLRLLAGARRGTRRDRPRCDDGQHQQEGGTASDIRIQAEQSLHIKSTMQKLIAEHTGQTLEQIEADSDRDRWFTAEQALTYGFIDHVYEAAAQIPSPQAPNQ